MTISKFEIENTFSTGKEGYDPEREAYERRLELARQQSHQAGFQEGHAQALLEIEAKTQETLGHVHEALLALFEARQATERDLEVEGVQLAHLIAKKLAANLLKKYPTEEIEKLIHDCLMSGYDEPKIVIRSSEELITSITDTIKKMMQTTGFQGELAFVPDPNLTDMDCSVQWPNGGASRDLKALEKQIQDKIERYINGPLDEVAVQPIEDNMRAEEKNISDEVDISDQNQENQNQD